MKFSFAHKCGSKKLIAFFSGFAAAENSLAEVELPQDRDTVVFYDYRNLDCDFDFSAYDEVSVVAWSFGIWVADALSERIRAVYRVAVNGSCTPVDDVCGIPRAVFEKTVSGFCESARAKFYARILGGSRVAVPAALSTRSADELRAELEFLQKSFSACVCAPSVWNAAIASRGDRIFSIASMRAQWGVKLAELEGAHYNPQAFARAFKMVADASQNVRRAFEKNISSYDEHAFVQRDICSTLAHDIADFVSEDFLRGARRVFEFGCGTGALGAELARWLPNAEWIVNDLSSQMCRAAAQRIGAKTKILCGDVRECAIPEGLDLAVSASCLQWIGNPRRLFARICERLKPDGLLAFSTFGENNFRQIREVLGKGLEYMSGKTLCGLLEESGFCASYLAEDLIDVDFASPAEVLRHIKSTGVNGGFSEFWTPAKYRDFCARYQEIAKSGDGVALTYNPVYIIAKKKI